MATGQRRIVAASFVAVFLSVPLFAFELAPGDGIGTEVSTNVLLSTRASLAQIRGTIAAAPAGTNLASVAFGRDIDGDGDLAPDETGLLLLGSAAGWIASSPDNPAGTPVAASALLDFDIDCRNGLAGVAFGSGSLSPAFPYDPAWTMAKIAVAGTPGGTIQISLERTRFHIRIAAR